MVGHITQNLKVLKDNGWYFCHTCPQLTNLAQLQFISWVPIVALSSCIYFSVHIAVRDNAQEPAHAKNQSSQISDYS